MALRLSRRVFVAGTAATVAAAGAGVAGVASLGNVDLVRSMLRRLVGAFEMPEPDLVAFTNDFVARQGKRVVDSVRVAAVRLTELSGVSSSAAVRDGDNRLRERLETFERQLLTQFIMSTTYVDVADPTTDQIAYFGQNWRMTVCGNPYAEFDLGEAS